MKSFKKGPRKGSYNPIGHKGAPKRDKSGPLEMHQATCVRCKKFCEVPFKPNGKKPVYCRDCFGIQEKGTPERTVVHTSVVPRDDMKVQIELLNKKIDTLTRMVESLVRTVK